MSSGMRREVMSGVKMIGIEVNGGDWIWRCNGFGVGNGWEGLG